MTTMWSYSDADGVSLTVAPCAMGHAEMTVRVGTRPDAVTVCIEPDAVPAVAAKLYEAAGRTVPLMLERPRVPQDGSRLRYGAFGMRMHDGGIAFSLPGVEVEAIPPDAALEVAAHIAAYAENAAARVPDPEHVTELADVLARAGAMLATTSVEQLARAAITWWQDKEAGR
jgi:hypothetical protein